MNTEPSLKEIAHWLRQKADRYRHVADYLETIIDSLDHPCPPRSAILPQLEDDTPTEDKLPTVEDVQAFWAKPPVPAVPNFLCSRCKKAIPDGPQHYIDANELPLCLECFKEITSQPEETA